MNQKISLYLFKQSSQRQEGIYSHYYHSFFEGYGLKRIYGFLAERFLSYWFKKNYKVKELPIIVKNLSDYKDL